MFRLTNFWSFITSVIFFLLQKSNLEIFQKIKSRFISLEWSQMRVLRKSHPASMLSAVTKVSFFTYKFYVNSVQKRHHVFILIEKSIATIIHVIKSIHAQFIRTSFLLNNLHMTYPRLLNKIRQSVTSKVFILFTNIHIIEHLLKNL